MLETFATAPHLEDDPMKAQCKSIITIALVGLFCLTAANAERWIGMPFTYQGQLKLDGEPVTGLVDFRFSLWNAVSGGTQMGTDYEPGSISVTDGLFTATVETWTFGPDAFTGEPRWLEIEAWDSGNRLGHTNPKTATNRLTIRPLCLRRRRRRRRLLVV